MPLSSFESAKRYHEDLTKRWKSVANTGKDLYGNNASLDAIAKEQSRVGTMYADDFFRDAMSRVGTKKPSTSVNRTSYRPTNRNTLSFAEALEQARSQVDPAGRIAEARTNKMFADNRSALPQILAARGQSQGGLRAEAEQGLTQEQAMALNEITLTQDAAAQELARRLQERSEDMGMAQDIQDFQRWLSQEQLNLQSQGMEADLAQRLWERQFREGEADRAAAQWDQSFAYQQARDSIMDNRWKAEFDENVRRFGLEYGLQVARENRQISNDAFNRSMQLARLEQEQAAGAGEPNVDMEKVRSEAIFLARNLPAWEDSNEAQRKNLISQMERHVLGQYDITRFGYGPPGTSFTYNQGAPPTTNQYSRTMDVLRNYQKMMSDDDILKAL